MGKEFILRFPWPPKDLSPNSRGHWGKKARAAKKYRGDCRLLAQAAGCRALQCDGLTVEVTFHPPDRRARDEDNMIASIKSALDGLADATGIDDSKTHLGHRVSDPVKGGCVLVHITPNSKGERGL